jgi:uncharacterized protein YjbI with pentapeptide repeats
MMAQAQNKFRLLQTGAQNGDYKNQKISLFRHSFIKMNEEIKNQGDLSTGDSREISKEEIKSILDNHLNWLNSKGATGEIADFKKAHLKGVVLMGANLREANFQEATLYGAYLKKADLERASLEGANLRGANLRWANLKHADLRGANLIRADLREADLEQTRLQGANLKMAEGLTRKQIDGALLDKSTVLPDYLK